MKYLLLLLLAQPALAQKWTSVHDLKVETEKCLKPEIEKFRQQVFGKLPTLQDAILNPAIHKAAEEIMRQVGAPAGTPFQVHSIGTVHHSILNATGAGISSLSMESFWDAEIEVTGVQRRKWQVNLTQSTWSMSKNYYRNRVDKLEIHIPSLKMNFHVHEMPWLNFEKPGLRLVRQGKNPARQVLHFLDLETEWGDSDEKVYFVDRNKVAYIDYTFALEHFTKCLARVYPD